jgi:hypothetical protein
MWGRQSAGPSRQGEYRAPDARVVPDHGITWPFPVLDIAAAVVNNTPHRILANSARFKK